MKKNTLSKGIAKTVDGSLEIGKPRCTKSMLYGMFGVFLVNSIAWVYLWVVNPTGNNTAPSMLWCTVNVIWLIVEILSTRRLERPIYKNWSVWVCCLFLLAALFTFAIYVFTEAMP